MGLLRRIKFSPTTPDKGECRNASATVIDTDIETDVDIDIFRCMGIKRPRMNAGISLRCLKTS